MYVYRKKKSAKNVAKNKTDIHYICSDSFPLSLYLEIDSIDKLLFKI